MFSDAARLYFPAVPPAFGMGRGVTYGGKIGQNGCQAAAASVLRSTLRKLAAEETEACAIGHTHDEILNEIDEDKAWGFADRLHQTMVDGFDWTEGLPLAAEVKVNWFYSKAKGMSRPH